MKRVIYFSLLASILFACNVDDPNSGKSESELLGAVYESELVKLGLSKEEAEAFATAGITSAKEAVVNLETQKQTAAIETSDFEVVVPALVSGAIKSMATVTALRLRLVDDTSKTAKLDELVSAGFLMLVNKAADQNLPAVSQQKMRGSIAKAAIVALKTSGVSEAGLENAITVLTKSAVGYLDDSGLASTDLIEALGDVSASLTVGLKEGGYAAASLDEYGMAIMSASVQSLAEISTDLTVQKSLMKNLVMKAVGNVDQINTELDQTASLDMVFDLTHGTVVGMGVASLEIATIDALIPSVIQGALEGFDDAFAATGATTGISNSADIYDDLLENIVGGVVAGYNSVFGSVSNEQDFLDDLEITVEAAVSSLASNYSMNEDNYQLALAGITRGAMRSLSNANYTEATHSTLILNVADSVALAAVGQIDEASIPLIGEDSSGNSIEPRRTALIGIVVGTVEGLEIMLPNTSLTTFRDEIIQTVITGMTSGGVVTDATTLQTELQTAINNVIDS